MSEWLARLSRSQYLGLLTLIAVVGLAPQYLSRTLPDIAFLLYAAGRLLDGATLYVDVIEINPPLIVWLNVPIVAIARDLGLSEIVAYRIAITLLLIVSAIASAVIMRGIKRRTPSVLPCFRLSVLLIVFALFVLPRLDWGEREHLTLALVLPYLLLGVARLAEASPWSESTGTVPPGANRTTLIALAAAIGIAIKPQFVLLWFVREGLVLFRTRRLTPEGIVIVAAGIGYIAAVAAFAPDYFALVRELGPAYRTFIHNPIFVTALLGDGAALILGAVIVAVVLWHRLPHRELIQMLALAAAVCYLAAVLQQKGWRYHYLPGIALAWILLGLIAASVRRRLVRWPERLFGSIAAAAAVTVAAAALAGALRQATDPLNARYDADPSIGSLVPLLEGQRGRPVAILSPNMASGFPLTTYAGTRWPLRYSNLWPVVAAYDSAIKDPAPLTFRRGPSASPMEARLRATVVEDLESADPAVLLVLRTAPDEPRWGMRRLDLLEFMSQDERFGRLLAGYDSAGIAGQYVVYNRRGGGTQLAVSPPPGAASPTPDKVPVERGSALAGILFLAVLAAFYRRTRPLRPLPEPAPKPT